jgi:hypothetical protein
MHIELLHKYWKGRFPKVYLITDKPTTKEYKDTTIVCFEGDMPFRLKKACEMVETEFVLITLDDYFIIDAVEEKYIAYLVKQVREKNIDYLQIYNRRYCKKKHYTELTRLNEINIEEKYAVNLYPAIWNKEFFIKCVDDDVNPWEFEPRLTIKAREYNAKCYASYANTFSILDVVRKGKVLHKANRYFKKNNISIGSRPLIERKYEVKQFVADFIWWYMPRWVYRFARRVGILLGMKFFSEE